MEWECALVGGRIRESEGAGKVLRSVHCSEVCKSCIEVNDRYLLILVGSRGECRTC